MLSHRKGLVDIVEVARAALDDGACAGGALIQLYDTLLIIWNQTSKGECGQTEDEKESIGQEYSSIIQSQEIWSQIDECVTKRNKNTTKQMQQTVIVAMDCVLYLDQT